MEDDTSFETASGPAGPVLVSHKGWFLIEVSCHRLQIVSGTNIFLYYSILHL